MKFFISLLLMLILFSCGHGPAQIVKKSEYLESVAFDSTKSLARRRAVEKSMDFCAKKNMSPKFENVTVEKHYGKALENKDKQNGDFLATTRFTCTPLL